MKLIFGMQPYYDPTRINMENKIGVTGPASPPPRDDATLTQQQKLSRHFKEIIILTQLDEI